MARRGDGIYQRGKGKTKTWWMDAWINGVRHQKRLGKCSRSVALELVTIERGKILRGAAGIGKKWKDLTFDEARQKFLDWVKTDKKANTLRSYAACLDYLSDEFSGKRLSQITAWSLEAYKKRRGEGRQLTERPLGLSDKEWERRCLVAKRGAPVRANRELSTLKTLFSKCIAWGLYEGSNPVCKVKLRKELKGRDRYLEPEEEHRLLAQLSGTLQALVKVGINTGLRIEAEALTLQWSSIDLKRAIVTVEAAYSKNGRTRTVPLNSVALEALKTLKAKTTTDYVFVKDDGSPYEGIGSSFRRACNRAKLPDVTPHTLRHTFASRLAMAGVDLRTLQELGGWQTLGMVQRYAHLAPSHKAQAVERIASVHFHQIDVSQERGVVL